jgi:hypothetical protein
MCGEYVQQLTEQVFAAGILIFGQIAAIAGDSFAVMLL